MERLIGATTACLYLLCVYESLNTFFTRRYWVAGVLSRGRLSSEHYPWSPLRCDAKVPVRGGATEEVIHLFLALRDDDAFVGDHLRAFLFLVLVASRVPSKEGQFFF